MNDKSNIINKKERKKKIAILYSGGKDSNLTLYKASKLYDIACLITLLPKNPYSYMYQASNVNITKYQAEALELPLIAKETEGKKEEELKELREALIEAKEKYGIEGVAAGTLYSNYQHERIKKIAKELDLFVYAPLWQINAEEELKELINNNFDVLIVRIASWPLTKEHVGKKLKDIFDFLVKRKKYLNIAGEGGEFDTIVLDQPLFKKRLVVEEGETTELGENEAEFIIKKVRLEDKKEKEEQ
ncbi:MAG: diphthine--ammonia ligase [Nanoarchaeota archaeon]